MSVRNTFPFSALITERKRMFCELYSSLIVHREMSSYLSMLDKIGDPQSLLYGGKISLNTVNACVQAIESSYSHRGIKFLINSVIDAVLDSFREENFEFFKQSLPQYRDLIESHSFSGKEVKLIENMLRAKLEGHKQICNDLDGIYEKIHSTFCQIYFDTTRPASTVNSKKGKSIGVVGPVAFSWGGAPVGDALADSVVDKKKQAMLINTCMTHILDYLRRVSAFHRYMMSSFYDLYQLFSDISDRYNHLEENLYDHLHDVSENIDDLFDLYYHSEISLMGQTYQLPIGEDGSPTFDDVVRNVQDHLQQYIQAQDAA